MGYYKRQNKVLDDLIAKNVKSPYAEQQLGLAKTMFGGRMFGAPQMEKNLLSSQGNVLNSIGRNATDASQALAASLGTQGETDQQFSDLQTKEQQNKYAMLQNLNQAYGVNIDEDRNNFQNLVALKGAKAQNELAKRKALWNTVGGIANLGVGIATGGFGGNLFGNGGGGQSQSVGVWNGNTSGYGGYQGG